MDSSNLDKQIGNRPLAERLELATPAELGRMCQHLSLKETASAEEIYKRAMKDGQESRPIIDKEDPKAEIEAVLKFRNPFYDAAAEITIETNNKHVKSIVNEILQITKL